MGRKNIRNYQNADESDARKYQKYKKYLESAAIGAAFTLFLLTACYKLDDSSLWFDETIEYWYSKIMFGALPFPDNSVNMYQRIISTLQPPLYNFLLYFWLKISDTQWWMRFFGVLSGFSGMIGLYKTVRKYGGALLASGAVCFAACLYRLVYYWQEAAEYSLMLGWLFWTVYFWTCLIETPSRKNMILFTCFAVLAVYSQYGAAFPAVALALSAYFRVICAKNRRMILILTACDILALLCAAAPLYFLFIRKQMPLQHGASGPEGILHAVSFDGGFLRDLILNFYRVFRWNFIPGYSWASSLIILLIFLMITGVILFRGNHIIKIYALANIFTWFLYYFAVKTGLYADMSYGGFGNRYNLFFLPLWIVYLFASGHEIYHILSGYKAGNFKNNKNKNFNNFIKKIIYKLRDFYPGVAICFLLCFCFSEWTARIEPNWNKGDLRGTVAAWYENGGQDRHTIVYYAAVPGFVYYTGMDSRRAPENNNNNIIYMNWDDSGIDYQAYLAGLYGDNMNTWPDEIDFIIAHRANDIDYIINAFHAAGYDSRDLYNHDFYDEEGGRLIRFSSGR